MPRISFAIHLALVLVVAGSTPSLAGSDQDAGHGMSSARLGRLTAAMERAVASGGVPAVSTLVFRNGVEAHFDAQGQQDPTTGVALARDTIFRIYSMSKPITSVATMILVEEGVIGLHAPVSKWLPELADVKVLKTPTSPLTDVEPLARPITVRDLLTHTAGLAYSFTAQGPLRQAISDAGLDGSSTEGTPDEFMAAMGALPLRHQPGTRWHYSLADDVLGVLIERASGMSFPDFLRTRIFEPLRMEDTGFWVPTDKLDRLSVNYARNPKTGELVVFDHPAKSVYAKERTFASGGGGLVSTIDDYMRFARMMLNNGELDGVRIVSRKTIERMTTDSLSPEEKTFAALGRTGEVAFRGNSYGLGVRVVTEPGMVGTLDSYGTHGWGGAAGTWYFVDPEEDLAAVLMVQVMGLGQETSIRADFDTLVHQAIID